MYSKQAHVNYPLLNILWWTVYFISYRCFLCDSLLIYIEVGEAIIHKPPSMGARSEKSMRSVRANLLGFAERYS